MAFGFLFLRRSQFYQLTSQLPEVKVGKKFLTLSINNGSFQKLVTSRAFQGQSWIGINFIEFQFFIVSSAKIFFLKFRRQFYRRRWQMVMPSPVCIVYLHLSRQWPLQQLSQEHSFQYVTTSFKYLVWEPNRSQIAQSVRRPVFHQLWHGFNFH